MIAVVQMVGWQTGSAANVHTFFAGSQCLGGLEHHETGTELREYVAKNQRYFPFLDIF